MSILFCCTNVDLYSYEELKRLERLELAPQVVHCLGLCHYCAQGRLAVVDGQLIVAHTAEAFWQALAARIAQLRRQEAW